TTPESPDHLDVYREWVARGRHGDMDYLAAERALERRARPKDLLPECESIVVVAAPYSSRPRRDGTARVAAYAVGEDYHQVLVDRMRVLVTALEVHMGHPVPHRLYADTGPILERELAQRAGLGWIGKNTCLIDPQRGSYLLLGEILLGLRLVADQPFVEDRCGSCTRCLEACPTHCILPDRTLDATRCISYLTIETRGEIEPELRPAIGDWVFGCDICQDVCPWNLRFARPADDAAFAPRPFLDPAQLTAFLDLDEEGYRTHLGRSPLKRAKRRGLLRNAAVTAGNSRDAEYVGTLARRLDDSEPLVRRHAAWGLGAIGGPEARRSLEEAAGRETDTGVLQEIAAALAQSTSPAR
ncbi:MAG: tRNA epoxyqueuosine(34) reductase QueG, partial [Anaerolineales bacterium]